MKLALALIAFTLSASAFASASPMPLLDGSYTTSAHICDRKIRVDKTRGKIVMSSFRGNGGCGSPGVVFIYQCESSEMQKCMADDNSGSFVSVVNPYSFVLTVVRADGSGTRALFNRYSDSIRRMEDESEERQE